MTLRVAVFGLGEAGSLIAGDLAAAGAVVHGYDPANLPTPVGVERHADPWAAVEGCELTLAVTAAADARRAMDQAWERIQEGSVYADLATASPTLETQMASKAARRGVEFADVALMAPVPGRGLATPALASGSGAPRLAEILNPMGAEITVIGDVAGLASGRKLLRSVVTKGLAALLLESVEAAEAKGEGEWIRDHLTGFLTEVDGAVIERLVSGTLRHADRRLAEMEAVAEYLSSLGVDPHMSRATVERLRPFVAS